MYRDSDTSSDNTSSDSNAFSIRCGKCADIHNAQLEGKTDKPCPCNCHDKPNYPTYIPYCPPDPCCPQIPYQPIWYYAGEPQFDRQPTTGDPPFWGYTTCWNNDTEGTY